MLQYSLKIQELTKYFGRRLIFQSISKEITAPGIYGITGSNGSGKSTFVKIIAGLLSPTKGKAVHYHSNSSIKPEHLHNYIGFLSPYLILYDEFTAQENISMFMQIRGLKNEVARITELFRKLNLNQRKNEPVKAFSSGMKQRLKLIFALAHSPALLILDEPTSNLDNEGKEQFYYLIKNYAAENIVLLASNEDHDLALCHERINLEDYK